ncbi:MAG TPA: nuclear transport factor 2 family protein [Jatrophihabitantaceae bacterium]|jgi:hypothetical protein
MTSTDTVVDGYFAMWNETDADKRREIIAATWVDDASYVDPMFTAAGHDGLDALAAGAQQQFPGHTFRLTTPVDVHHDRARWGWDLVSPDGNPVVIGVDYAVLSDDGRLREITGFFEPPAAS